MLQRKSHPQKRLGFTLVELLVVILIIAVLVTLLSSAVVVVLGKKPEVQTKTEMAQLDVALRAFMSDYQISDPPPSVLLLREDLTYNTAVPLENQSAVWLRRIFGKNLGAGLNPLWIDWNGDNIPNGPWLLEGEHCLVFWTGGIPNTQAYTAGSPPAPLGFSTNNMNPAQPGGKRRGPYMDFNTTRLVAGGNGGFFYYLDPWMLKTGPSPYVYFSSQGIMNAYGVNDCKSFDMAGPYALSPTSFTNPNTYQIISAGKDGKFGGGIWNPMMGAQGPGADDQASFSSTLLGVGQN